MPKIAEINTICSEIGRENVKYEPDIETQVKNDGTKHSRVVVRVYPDKTNRDESGLIAFDTFIDDIYFKVKDMYEDYEEKGYMPGDEVENELDGETFGWNLTDEWI